LHGVLGESADIVKANNVGMVFEPENAQELYEKLVTLKNDSIAYRKLQEQALAASKKYDRTALAKNFWNY